MSRTCTRCNDTGIVISTGMGPDEASRVEPTGALLRLFGPLGPALRIELCPHIRKQLDRALYFERHDEGSKG